ncbi:MAG: B12-binding domain-containing radical SAM protein [Rhodospirillaceae bacterium]|nr:B12-binding domain-containing radical SAM protein [Rhodospirillaceae bacterium]
MSEEICEALRSRIKGYTFEGGALLVQIHQVPFHALDAGVARARGYFAYPPQSLLYLSAVFDGLGIQPHILDLNFHVLKEMQKKDGDPRSAWVKNLNEGLAVFDRPVVCLSLMFDSTYEQFRETCEYIKKNKPDAFIAVGGVAATADPERILRDGLADIVFSHEGESSLRRFYEFLRGENEELPINLSFLNGEGELVQAPMASGGEVDLDIRDQYARLPIAEYHQVGSLSNFSRMNGLDVPFATILSRRGCRAHCSFCGVRNFNGKGIRVRSRSGVIDEMEWLYRNYGIRYFDWLDDDLLYNSSDCIKMFEEISERLPGISWGANNGVIAAAVTPEILDAMEKSGCIGYKIGLESGNPDVLRQVHKPTNLAKFFEFSERARSYPKMFTAVNFIMGFPGETFSQMRDSFATALSARLDWNSFYVYQHLKNTELYIAYGGTSGGVIETEDGKDGQLPTFNPVRSGGFEGNYAANEDILTGYEVFDHTADIAPGRAQLREIWFTFNIVANFLRMPALFSDSEARLRNSILWMKALCQAYPSDPSMSCLLYFLQRRSGAPVSDLETLQNLTIKNLKASDYWMWRDSQFGFSSFLDGIIPEADPCVDALLASGPPNARRDNLGQKVL